MPRMPKKADCDCYHTPVNASEDIKLKILEEKLNAQLVMGEHFFTKVAVGNLPKNSEIKADDLVRDVLFRILGQGSERVLESISIDTPPAKVIYTAGETFNPAGMVVRAHYSDSTQEVITNYTYTPTGALAVTDTKVTVTYEGKSAEQAITVNAPSTNITVYKGLLATLPTTEAEIEALASDSKSKASLLTDGYLWKNVSPNNQYIILAIPDEANIDCYSILQGTYSMDPVRVDIGKYRLYHTGNPVVETGYRLTYLFEED